MKKFRIEDAVQVCLARKIKFGDLEGLLEKTLLKFDQKPVIPRKDGDFEIGAGYFTDNAHKELQLPKGKPKPVRKEALLVFLLIVQLALEVVQLALQVPIHGTRLKVVLFHLPDYLLQLRFALAQERFHCRWIRFHSDVQ